MPEIEVRAQRVAFPAICPICSMPATHQATVSRFMGIPGVFSQSVRLLVPFCEHHHALYTRSDLAIRRLTRSWVIGAALTVGAVTILAILAINGFSISKFAPGILIFGVVICSASIMSSIAAAFFVPIIGPLVHHFDPPETKAVRKLFHIGSFNVNPGRPPVLTRVNFLVDNPTYAEALAKANGAKIIN